MADVIACLGELLSNSKKICKYNLGIKYAWLGRKTFGPVKSMDFRLRQNAYEFQYYLKFLLFIKVTLTEYFRPLVYFPKKRRQLVP